MLPATIVSIAIDTSALQRRTLRVLIAAQVLGGIGLVAVVAVGPLLARQLFDQDLLSGLPSALATAGGALAAVPISRLMSRRGRRPGLVGGYAAGAVGSLIVVAAAASSNGPLLGLGAVVFGAGNSASLLARYAAADLAEPDRRGRAVSIVLFSTTFGAVAGPNLLGPTGHAAVAFGLPKLAGPFMLSTVAYLAAVAVVVTMLRPDPLVVAQSGQRTARSPGTSAGALALALRGKAGAATAVLMGTQFVMVAVMTMTPVDMSAHDERLSVIGLVISIHVAGMYVLSPLVGLAADRFGREPTIVVGGICLMLSGLVTTTGDHSSTTRTAMALLLLGVGWSLGLVAASAMLVESVPITSRAAVQGVADLLLGGAGAVGALGSGIVTEAISFQVLALGALAVASVMTVGTTFLTIAVA